MDVRESIKKLREDNGLTQEQLGEIAGVSSMAVSQWENGRAVPRMGSIQRMADHFNVPKSIIMGDTPIYSTGHVSVPLLGRIAAGEPLEMDEVEDTGEVPGRIHDRYPEGFLLKVSGESMNRILPNGCYAYIEPCSEVTRDNKPYAVCVNGYDATIKRVRRLENGFELAPDSNDPTYRPIVYDYGVEGTDKITIIGRVVYYVLPYDWEF